MKRPSERQLDRLLARLPRTAAPPDLSRRVLASLDAAVARPSATHGWLLAAAAAAVALTVGLWLQPRSDPQPAAAETRALREEHRQLMEELESLKASLRDTESAPVLYLGGNEQFDLVLDLAPVWRDASDGGIRPAFLEAGGRPQAAADRRTGDGR